MTPCQKAATGAIEDLRQTYLSVSRKSIERVLALIGQEGDHDEAWRNAIFRLAHDLKGQGPTFGHDLVTRIAASLCTLIRDGGACADEAFAKRASAHAEAMRAILEEDIRGNGGEHGAALLKILSIEG